MYHRENILPFIHLSTLHFYVSDNIWKKSNLLIKEF